MIASERGGRASRRSRACWGPSPAQRGQDQRQRAGKLAGDQWPPSRPIQLDPRGFYPLAEDGRKGQQPRAAVHERSSGSSRPRCGARPARQSLIQ